MFQYKHTKEIRNAILQNDKAFNFFPSSLLSLLDPLNFKFLSIG